MIDIIPWTQTLAQHLSEAFGPRLRFVGFQGSYARGEATADSDIDIVAVLDRLTAGDLDTYRGIVRTMPEHELACGFVCGAEELKCWPRWDLLSLALDTRPVLGDLSGLLPEFTGADRREALGMGASMLYHAACHTYLYGDRAGELGGILKQAFFCLRLWELCRSGRYCGTKSELRKVLTGQELMILDMLAGVSPDMVDSAYDTLIAWSSQALRQAQA